MSNLEKYTNVFMESFGITKEQTEDLKYTGIPEWDSVGHMTLMAMLEDTFEIMMETEDIIEFSSFEKGKTIMGKYGIEL